MGRMLPKNPISTRSDPIIAKVRSILSVYTYYVVKYSVNYKGRNWNGNKKSHPQGKNTQEIQSQKEEPDPENLDKISRYHFATQGDSLHRGNIIEPDKQGGKKVGYCEIDARDDQKQEAKRNYQGHQQVQDQKRDEFPEAIEEYFHSGLTA